MDTSIFYLDEKITIASFFVTAVAFTIGIISLLQLSNYTSKTKLQFAIKIFYSLFFFILALDEYFELHELSRELIYPFFDNISILESLFNFSWVFVLLIPILMIFIFFIGYIFSQKKLVNKVLMFLGLLCFAIVIVLELVGGSFYGQEVYILFVGIEEVLEMIGVSFFFSAEIRKLMVIYKNND